MGRKLGLLGLSVAALLAWAVPAAAAVSSVAGAAEIVTAPTSVAVGVYESSTNVRVFNERQVNLAASLTISFFNQSGVLVPRTLNVGVCVQSHMIHFDEAAGQPAVLTGSATFDMPIIAVIPTNINILGFRALDATDPVFGVLGTTYPTVGNNSRSVEAILGGDSLSYSFAQPSRLGFTLNSDGFDQMRVLTECAPDPVVPEVPVAVMLPLGGMALVGGWLIVNHKRFA